LEQPDKSVKTVMQNACQARTGRILNRNLWFLTDCSAECPLKGPGLRKNPPSGGPTAYATCKKTRRSKAAMKKAVKKVGPSRKRVECALSRKGK
jgi:hypothetical protein